MAKKTGKNVENTAAVESTKAPAKSGRAKADAAPAKKTEKKAKAEKTPSTASSLRGAFPTLVGPQIRILLSLATAKNALHDAAVAERANVQRTWLTGFAFKACKANKTPSLVEQGFVKTSEIEFEGRKCRGAVLTAKGKQVVERLRKAGAK